jgi:hypothetical protein
MLPFNAPLTMRARVRASTVAFAACAAVACTTFQLDGGGGDGGTETGALDGARRHDGEHGDATGDAGSCACAAGCCDDAGACQPGTAATACGSGGQACNDCTEYYFPCAPADGGGTCAAEKVVTCPPENCGGCCLGNTCLMDGGMAACGARGGACIACPLGESCVSGACTASSGCGPSSCLGCCNGATCDPGVSATACGAGGAACQPCPGTPSEPGCFATGPYGGGICTLKIDCGPANCAGCCDPFYVCHAGTEQIACGTGGGPCGVCSGGGACTGSTCSNGTCSGMNCPDGCCDGFGVCQHGTTASACAASPGLCAVCPGGSGCDAGTCVPM